MSRGRQYIEFEGLFSESVLGTASSGALPVCVTWQPSLRAVQNGRRQAGLSIVVGHQRMNRQARRRNKKLPGAERENRFLLEVILSVRAPVKLMVNRERSTLTSWLGETVFGVKADNGGLLDISRRYSSLTMRMQRLRTARRSGAAQTG